MPLTAHFLNVGQGDCTIIEFPSGRVAIVDIDNLRALDASTREEVLQDYHESVAYFTSQLLGRSEHDLDTAFLAEQEEKLTDPLAYYDARIGRNRPIFRLMITHPDMDHMTGLTRLVQDATKSICNFWHIGHHDFNLANADDDEWYRYDSDDWETYKRLRGGENVTSLNRYAGATGDFWAQDGIEFWAPTAATEQCALDRNESNIISMVLKISYRGRSILLGGDATAEETWPLIYPDINMTGIHVLKASHHGRKTGFNRAAVSEMSPWLTITSVGEREHDATDSYRRLSDYTVSLRRAGDVRITIEDDGRLMYETAIEEHWKPRITA